MLFDGFIPFITFEDGEITRISFAPVRRNDEASNPGDIEYLPPDSVAFREISDLVIKLSEPYGLKFELDGDEYVVTSA